VVIIEDEKLMQETPAEEPSVTDQECTDNLEMQEQQVDDEKCHAPLATQEDEDQGETCTWCACFHLFSEAAAPKANIDIFSFVFVLNF
jgi:hypothetical protein